MQLSVKKLYLGGVKEPLTEDDLKGYFSKYGTITDAVIMKDREGQYRGYRHIYSFFVIIKDCLSFRYGFIVFDE
jgi:RNA recognition motif-containing protein